MFSRNLKQVIVSVTSYPARINEVVLAIKTIYRQTMLPDKVILWLCKVLYTSYGYKKYWRQRL